MWNKFDFDGTDCVVHAHAMNPMLIWMQDFSFKLLKVERSAALCDTTMWNEFDFDGTDCVVHAHAMNPSHRTCNLHISVFGHTS